MTISNPSRTSFLGGLSRRALRASLVAAVSLGALALIFVPSVAWAYDEVSLQNGGIIKGEILVLQPGEKVVIQVPGEDNPRTVPWSAVNDVVRDNQDEASRQPSGGAGNRVGADDDDDRDQPNKTGKVRIHIDAKGEDASLIEHLGTTVGMVGGVGVYASHVRLVCKAPCDKVVDASRGQQFIITGEDMPTSAPFSLHTHRGDITADVDPGSDAGVFWGATMGSIGILGVLGGGTTILVGALVEGEDGDDILAAGAVTTGVAAALLVGGIVMATNSGTDVHVSPRRVYSGGYEARAPRYWLGEF